MNIYLEGLNLKSAIFCQIYPSKIPAFILTLELQDYHLIINGLLCLAIIIMILLLAVMAKGLRNLKDAALGGKEKGNVWINKNLYDFDAEQLKILIKKINKADRNDKPVETKN